VAEPRRSGEATAGAAVRSGDGKAFYAYAAVMLAAIVALCLHAVANRGWEPLGLGLVAAWAGFCAISNVLPVPVVRNIYLSMGSPVNIAVAYLFPPSLAATIVFASSLSEWEIKRETTVLHAAFNRAQLACSTALASAVFAAYPDNGPVMAALILTVVVYQASNWLFVAGAEWSARGVPVLRVLRGLVPAGFPGAATYLALGLMGVVLALTSVRVGTWAVALLMLPLLGARHAVRVSGQLEQAERERRSLADRLIDERERERVRIASDIHDVVLQQLAALQLDADNIGAALDHGRPDLAVRLAGQLRGGIDGSISQLRGTIASLRRTAIGQGGLVASLEQFARTFRASSGVEVEVSAEGVGDDLALPVALLVLECSQEALTNVARHAGAQRVMLSVIRTGGAIELRVTDDGVGFDAAATAGAAAGAGSGGSGGAVVGGAGLALTREKVALAGGILFVQSQPGAGTTVTVRVPVGSAP